MSKKLALIGFGEAGRTFATAGQWGRDAAVFDLLHNSPAMRDSMESAQVSSCNSLAQALEGAPLIISLVTADQAPIAAGDAAALIQPGAIYCDLNSVAPQTKQASAQLIEAAGGHYVDVAVMAPVDPAHLSVPLLLSGDKAQDVATLLADLGFTKIRIVGDDVGRASSIKMIRSVMVKGIEALTAECVFAAEKANVLDEVLSSLDASEKPRPWDLRADYNLDRMMIHGQRRAAEMEEVVKTLEGLGTGAMMTQGTVLRQRAIGDLGLKTPETGLTNKINQVNTNGGMQGA